MILVVQLTQVVQKSIELLIPKTIKKWPQKTPDIYGEHPEGALINFHSHQCLFHICCLSTQVHRGKCMNIFHPHSWKVTTEEVRMDFFHTVLMHKQTLICIYSKHYFTSQAAHKFCSKDVIFDQSSNYPLTDLRMWFKQHEDKLWGHPSSQHMTHVNIWCT